LTVPEYKACSHKEGELPTKSNDRLFFSYPSFSTSPLIDGVALKQLLVGFLLYLALFAFVRFV